MTAANASVVEPRVVREGITKTDKYPDGEFGLTWLSQYSAGSGTFVLRKWEKGDSAFTDANSGHYLQPSKVNRVIIKETPEAARQRLQTTKGDTDLAWLVAVGRTTFSLGAI
jgi:peptide/nickel transport system substrate-binding protein